MQKSVKQNVQVRVLEMLQQHDFSGAKQNRPSFSDHDLGDRRWNCCHILRSDCLGVFSCEYEDLASKMDK